MKPNENRVAEKLDMLIRLLAAALLDGKSQRDQIRILSKAGFQPKEIADLLSTTSNNVRVQLVAIRRRKG